MFTTAKIIYQKTVIALVCHLNCSKQKTVTINKTITALAIIIASFAANASVLPKTPVPFKSGTGAINNNTVYISLSSASTA